jgi:hypothetical protein
LALTSTTLTNLGHLRERDAAAALPCLSMRRPLHSVTLLLTSRRWALGFAMEASGFLLYALALALLTLVQSIAAGEVGVQLGYQTGGAVTVAGLATLLSNAVPIVAGTLVLHEPCRPGRSAICGHSRSWRSAQARSCWRSPTIRAQRDRFGGWCHVCAALIACHESVISWVESSSSECLKARAASVGRM